jgi:hypothetical protein
MPLKINNPYDNTETVAVLQDGTEVKKKVYNGAMGIRIRKIREQMAKRTQPNAKGYTWTMGYNNCVGRYTQDREFPRFSGSSWNRSLKNNSRAKESLHTIGHLYAMADQVAEICLKTGWYVSEAFCNLLLRRDQPAKDIYDQWISTLPGFKKNWFVDESGLRIHLLSPRSRGKVRDKATALYRSCSGSRIFATCTFVAQVDDQTGVAILNKFLTAIRKEFGRVEYLWVAERQDENKDFPGNIHFHLLMNKRLPIKRWNAMWVLQQYNAGLRAKNKYKEPITMEEVLEKFESGRMQDILNPLDVKKIYGISGLSHYLTKYITKQEGNVPFACSVWHCSRRVSRMFTKSVTSPSAFRYCMSLANCRVDKKTGEVFEAKEIVKPFYVMVYINNKTVPLNYLREMEQINKWILAGHQLDRLWNCSDDEYKKFFLTDG